MAERKTRGVVALAAWNAEQTQEQIAALLGCTQQQVSQYLSHTNVPGYKIRAAALEHRGIPLGAWDEIEPEAEPKVKTKATPRRSPKPASRRSRPQGDRSVSARPLPSAQVST